MTTAEILSDRSLTPAERLVLLALREHAEDGVVRASARQVGEWAGITERGAYRCLQGLQAAGAVTCPQVGRGRAPSTYALS